MSFIIHEILSGYLQTLLSLWLPIKSVVLKNIQTPGGNFTEDPLRYWSLIMPVRGRYFCCQQQNVTRIKVDQGTYSYFSYQECSVHVCTYAYAYSTLGTRGFSCVWWEFSVLAEGWHIFGHEWRSGKKKPLVWRGAIYCPRWPLNFFIGLHLHQVSNCDHVDRHVKKCPKTHIILRKTSLSLKFKAIMTESHRSSP